MNTQTPMRSENRGFTLVELLVVIAIIGILAGIVVPNVPRYIMNAKYADAVTEINGIDTSLVGILSDTGRSSFKEFFSPRSAAYDDNDNVINQDLANFYVLIGADDTGDRLNTVLDNYSDIQDFYNNFFYEIIRQGRGSQLVQDIVRPEIYQKLGTSYMEIERDPWDSQYNFWMGPHRRGPQFLRSYRVSHGEDTEGDEEDFQPYIWDVDARQDEIKDVPGQPREDGSESDGGTVGLALKNSTYNNWATPNGQINGYGYPAPREIPSSVYVWSIGPNLMDDASLVSQFRDGQDKIFFGGGDDPNNWDNQSGWQSAPK